MILPPAFWARQELRDHVAPVSRPGQGSAWFSQDELCPPGLVPVCKKRENGIQRSHLPKHFIRCWEATNLLVFLTDPVQIPDEIHPWIPRYPFRRLKCGSFGEEPFSKFRE